MWLCRHVASCYACSEDNSKNLGPLMEPARIAVPLAASQNQRQVREPEPGSATHVAGLGRIHSKGDRRCPARGPRSVNLDGAAVHEWGTVHARPQFDQFALVPGVGPGRCRRWHRRVHLDNTSGSLQSLVSRWGGGAVRCDSSFAQCRCWRLRRSAVCSPFYVRSFFLTEQTQRSQEHFV